jgi:uncharacterized protein (DUF1499 family)
MDATDTRSADRRAHLGTMLTWLALGVGLACAAAALLAGPGYRMELLSLGAGIQTIRWAATVALVGAGVALLGLVLRVAGRSGPVLALVALVLNAVVAGPPLSLYWTVQHVPKIHDVSTDTTDPPTFVAVIPLRKHARNPVDYPSQTAAQQKLGYPDIAPLTLPDAPAQAFERAERAAGAMGWEIVDVAPTDLRIEATDTTLLFGFKDDIVIRIRPQSQGSVVDVRSLSRVGGSDFGVNAKRVRAFLHKLADQR